MPGTTKPSKPATPAKPATPQGRKYTQTKLGWGSGTKDGKGAGAKKKPQQLPNGNIANYFLKPEEKLFLDDPSAPATAPPKGDFGDDKDDEDIYGLEDDVKGTASADGPSALKRRKLSHNGSNGFTSLVEGKDPDPVKKEPEKGSATETETQLPKRKRPVRRRTGPFLADSDSEDEMKKEAPTMPMSNGSTPSFPALDHIPSFATPLAPKPAIDESGTDAPTDAAVLKQETFFYDEFPDLENIEGLFDDDEFADGEEVRAKRYMEEQAKLEAEAEAEDAGGYTSDCIAELPPKDDEGTTATCPLCSASLSGITPEEATVHVNACLDGNPIPLPAASKPAPANENTVDAPEMGKRFAKTAVPRPGQANPISLGGTTADKPTSAFSKLMSGNSEDVAFANAAAAQQAARGRPAYERTCPFYKIMPGLSICVDAFRYGAVQGCKAYFLSHFHSDHYIGLSASWKHGPIYCSKVTGSLVKNQLKTAAKFVVELEFEETVEVPGTEGVMVTMIPANHCPGSSLFLFEKSSEKGPNPRTQRILHCGDFRACPAHVTHPLLKPDTIDAISGKVKHQKIDICYLDTTYLNPRYAFPPQDDVIRACADFCKSLSGDPSVADEAFDALRRERGTTTVSKFFPKDGDTKPTNGSSISTSKPEPKKNRLLVVCGTYSIGKERVCKAIAQALGSKIYANPHKMRLCAQLDDPELAALMTPHAHEAQVHMQALQEIRAETLQAYLETYKKHGFTRIVGFRPSGWSFSAQGSKSNATISATTAPSSVPTTAILHGPAWRPRFGSGDFLAQPGSTREAMCFGVPYSEHSSFRELALFLMALRVERVVPTVNVAKEATRARMKGWTDRWLAERRKGGVVRVLEDGGGEGAGGGGGGDEKTTKKMMKGEGEPALWDGKDGQGGGVVW
ncbi:Uu.00g048440.m01.CDS01 [Anthostomella pinea]|uniref:Uu.00g048440.m01.CDS01 n=1 Tax=Anthostomella pinea TaxID=933095 RepID=A0AAI8YEL3_9PEZI|nr:Uu.00g048440.m01.CDS01 [Anthostomella pinea]